MKILKSLVLFAAFAPASAFAQGSLIAAEAELDRLRDALVAVGCVVDTEEAALAVEADTGFDEALLEAAVGQLRALHEIEDASNEGGIKYVSGGCSN
ncbi:hypothetical protein [Actibacterium sp. MT2.3-13A]|uniref:hypothetical protein n=1 Tax=Actibacterium sp. MT2.3-13A TaxID=2828332 RepID=UPI001BA68927|nr:hypothetical protein [Actibacterium sp. MT2.3-13A]